MLYKVSVIVPVYNAENTLPVCLRSLTRQGLDGMEICFVDDCSQDNSLSLLAEFKNNVQDFISVKILRHSRNRGVAAARNTGLSAAEGEYVSFVDADDYLEDFALRDWYAEAKYNNWDVAGCELMLKFNSSERYLEQRAFDTPEHALQNIMLGLMKWNLWLYLIKRDIFEVNSISCVEGLNMGEDLMIMMKVFMSSNKVGLIKKPLYHYNQGNVDSLTHVYSESHIKQVVGNVAEIEAFAAESARGDFVLENLPYLKLNVKLPLLMTSSYERYSRWQELYQDANEFIWKNKSLPFRTRLLQWAASKNCWFLVRLYHILIYKFIYGVIYK